MLKGLKQKIQNKLLRQAEASYKVKLEKKRDKYNELLDFMFKDVPYVNGDKEENAPGSGKEETSVQGSASLTALVVFVEEFIKGFTLDTQAPFVVFSYKNGKLHEAAPAIMQEVFDNPKVSFVYADEDCICGDRHMNPWLKPDYSPDTLMSFLYMGSPVAIRTQLLNEILSKMELCEDGYVNYYDFILRATELLSDDEIAHCKKVLFSKYIGNEQEKTVLPGTEAKFNEIKVIAASRRGYTMAMYCDKKNRWQTLYKPEDVEDPLVSVIIPSKDQPELMQECLEALYEKNEAASFEVIVIDNGSAGANRLRMTSLKEKFGFNYYYEPGEFHFAKMCNFGAKKAKGKYLLFLNDDTKMMMDNTLLSMAGQCEVSHVGAVGVKLLYADGVTIQHVGIANSKIGPIHKFIGKKDDISHYYGQNDYPMNVIGVTGACMMVKAERFNEVEGFDEIFAVSYNDVDLCYKLHKAGYYNVVRNDISVIHYESMSRGNDADAKAKLIRLKNEQTALIDKHPDMTEFDPYYSMYIDATKDEFTIQIPGLNKQYSLEECKKDILPQMENEALNIVTDCVKAEDKTLHLDGWWYVKGYNNARYKASLVLKNKTQDKVFMLDFEPVLREDVALAMIHEINVELSGFSVMLLKSELPAGEYEIGMYVKDTCSRQKLFKLISRDNNIII